MKTTIVAFISVEAIRKYELGKRLPWRFGGTYQLIPLVNKASTRHLHIHHIRLENNDMRVLNYCNWDIPTTLYSTSISSNNMYK